MSLLSSLMGLNASGIITALKGNGGRLVTATVQMLLLRDRVRKALNEDSADQRLVLERLELDLKMIGFGMVAGKKKLMRRVLAAYDLAKNL